MLLIITELSFCNEVKVISKKLKQKLLWQFDAVLIQTWIKSLHYYLEFAFKTFIIIKEKNDRHFSPFSQLSLSCCNVILLLYFLCMSFMTIWTYVTVVWNFAEMWETPAFDHGTGVSLFFQVRKLFFWF